MKIFKKITLITLLSISSLNAGNTKKVKLPNIAIAVVVDEDFKVMQRNCQWCHSFGYVTNQGKQSYKFWEKSVIKMRDIYKAPISKKDGKLATEYLFRHFGNGVR